LNNKSPALQMQGFCFVEPLSRLVDKRYNLLVQFGIPAQRSLKINIKIQKTHRQSSNANSINKSSDQ